MNEAFELEVALFNAALQLPVSERAAYLAEACGTDDALRGRVESLLATEGLAEGFLETPVSGAIGGEPDEIAAAGAVVAEKPGDTIGRYKLLQQIGEGGCGVVYMAEQEEPVRRRVALKVIKLGMDTRSVIGRFEAERQALARMDHPNIARVFDAGATGSGRPYFVMELVRGVKITDFCDENQLALPERLELFVQVCRAVQHAHQKGIIHRDLKPSNILVTVNDGVAVPKVIDFGIAKATEGRLTDRTVFTAFEQFIGTPAYMSPEQAVMTSADVDTRSDIYSLGVLLYELLTGRPPFSQAELMESGVEEMRRTIREREPAKPSTRLSTMGAADLVPIARSRKAEPPGLIHLVRGDLDWIVMKCLEKERARRYETANGLAMDVKRFLASEPILARPPSRVYRFRKMVARNRVTAAAVFSVGLALFVGLGVSTWQYQEKSRAEREQSRLREQAQQAQASEARFRREAQAHELSARMKAYSSDMKLLQFALASDDLGRAQELLDRQRPQPGHEDLRGWEWRYLWQFCQSDAAFTICQRSNSITAVSFSPDGSLLAVGTWAGEVTVWDVVSRQLVFSRARSAGGTGRLAFSARGNLLAYDDSRPESPPAVMLWDGGTRAESHRLPLKGTLRDLAFLDDGSLVTADFGASNNIIRWDVAGGVALNQQSAPVASSGMGTVFNASRDGGRFAHAVQGAYHSLRVVDAAGREAFLLRVADELTTAVAFSPDGRTLVTGAGYAEGAIRLWDVEERQLLGMLEGHRSWVSCVKFLPSEGRLASASADRTVRIWDLATRRPVRTLHAYGGELWTLDVTPDGRWLAGGSKDGSVILWDLSVTNRQILQHRVLDPGAGWSGATYSPDGRLFGVVRKGRLQVYSAVTLEPFSLPSVGPTNVTSFGFTADMRFLLATVGMGELEVWTWPGLVRQQNVPAHSRPAILMNRATPSGRVLTYGTEHRFKAWDPVTWREVRGWEIDADMNFRTVAAQAGWVGTANENGWIELTPIEDPGHRARFKGPDRLSGIDLSTDGATLAAVSENGVVEVWDTRTRTRLALLRGVLLGYHSVAISPDGARLLAGSNGQEAIKIWDLASHEEVATLVGQGSFFSDLAVAPDGNTIVARNWNRILHFWTAPSWSEIEAAEAGGRVAAGTARP
jgi:serine/threonine protein kinase/WD40 repeat protein